MTTNARPANRVIGTQGEAYDEMEAIRRGLATMMIRCPVDDSLQGVESIRTVRPTNHNAFDGGDVITLRCGHKII